MRFHPRFRFPQIAVQVNANLEWDLTFQVPRDDMQSITLASGGSIWIGGSDIRHERTLMGYPVTGAVREWSDRLDTAHQGCYVPVFTAYHGTHSRYFDSIVSTGLRETWGMLGTGIYVTTAFARAARRYALRDTYYRLRSSEDSMVLRVYIPDFEGFVLERGTQFSHPCACDRCISDPKLTHQRRCVSDHASVWRDLGYLGAMVSRDSIYGKGIVSNDEYCLDGSLVTLASAHCIDAASATHGPNNSYNPKDTTLKIL